MQAIPGVTWRRAVARTAWGGAASFNRSLADSFTLATT